MHRTRLASLLLALPFAGIGSAQSPTWKAELLGTPPPGWSIVAASAVNDAGTTVGFTYISGYKHAWIAGPGQALELLPLPPGANWSDATDINSSGVVSGSVLFGGSSSQAVIWKPGPGGHQVTLLPAGPGGVLPFNATGINDAGEVIGKLGILSGSYHWTEAGGVVQLPSSAFPVVPEDINNERQIVGDTYRMDLDTLVLEDLGNPTGTGFNYIFTKLSVINDAGQCGGYANVATGMSASKQAVRYTDGLGWKAFNNIPLITANVMGIANNGDTVFQLGIYGLHVWVDGIGSIPLQNTLDPAYAHFDLTGAFAPFISPGSLMATNGLDTTTGAAGIVLLTPLGDLPTTYCSSLANSSGQAATISAAGTGSFASNSLVLSAQGLPPSGVGIFYFGTQAMDPGIPFGEGLRCVGGTTERLGPVALSGGAAVQAQDLTSSAYAGVTPGDTRYFQFWFRDPVGGPAGFNLSDALEVPFFN